MLVRHSLPLKAAKKSQADERILNRAIIPTTVGDGREGIHPFFSSTPAFEYTMEWDRIRRGD